MLRKCITSILLVFLAIAYARADEGMWLPLLLQKLNEKEMKAMGLKITAADIYSINKGSLKDAVIIFGGGCTGEIISNKGLILTNHHCGFDAIQNHSSLEHNYIKNGFWAASFQQELSNPGLTATFINRMEDVTSLILKNVNASLTEPQRQSQVDKNIDALKKTYVKEAWQDLVIKPFYEGNAYYLFVTETYRDIRLVGAPPSSIGNYGKDTDNWMWPRHTGDFSIFRIYADKNNRPADYSLNNIPFTPKKSLSISLNGVKENDFSMVMGFPGRTMEYLTSHAVKQVVEVNDPAKISVREKALYILDSFMRSSEEIKIQYAAKYAGIQNAYKKWQGEVLGLTKTFAVGKKQNYEAEFSRRVQATGEWRSKYGNILDQISTTYENIKMPGLYRDYFNEIVSKIELFKISSTVTGLLNVYDKEGEKGYTAKLEQAKQSLSATFEEYNVDVDKRLFESLMPLYTGNLKPVLSPVVAGYLEKGDINSLAQLLYTNSSMPIQSRLLGLLDKTPAQAVAALQQDPALQVYNSMVQAYNQQVLPQLNQLQAQLNLLQRTYMQAQMDVMKEKKFYPDANSTLRITYGKVKGYNPRDAVMYHYATTLEGVLEKYKPGDYEYDLPARLIELYKKKDYGRYGVNGTMPVCFIAQNHTTGGNSGSPALDAYGNLIGLNFDRVWEGTMSDINYDPSICRNIMVDIRYVLFIVDKFAGAQNLINELHIINAPK